MLFRSGVRGAVMLGFGGAGLLAHTLFLYHRAVTTSGAAPLSSSFDWYMLAAWLLAGIYFYLTYYHPQAAIGLFLLPLVLALVGAAHLADREPFARSPAAQAWGAIHGVFWLLGTVAVLFGFMAGMMYLFQAWRLKRKLPPLQGLRMPSLEWLARSSSRAIGLSAVMIGLGLASGAILNAVNHAVEIDRVAWSDPAIVTSAAMFLWLLTTAIFSAVYRPARQGRKVAYLTVANFVFLAIALGVMLLIDTDHGSSRSPDETSRFPRDSHLGWLNNHAVSVLPRHAVSHLPEHPPITATQLAVQGGVR